jgi:diguanylate cyclase (GGDEF)-like protein/PAS domain S-box-containing protein
MTTASHPRSSALRILFSVLSLLALVAYAYSAIGNWREVRRGLESGLAYENKLLTQAVHATMVTHSVMLKSIGDGLLLLGALEQPESGREFIEKMQRTDQGMAGFGFVRADGQLLLISRVPAGQPLPNLLASAETRDSFAAALEAKAMQVGRPYFQKQLGEWVIPIRQPFYDAAGKPLVVMTAGYRIEGGNAAWAQLATGPDVTVLLLRNDGYRQYQYPLPGPSSDALLERLYGKPVPPTLLNSLRQQPAAAGTVELEVEGVPMLAAYNRLDDYGLYAVTMQPLAKASQAGWAAVLTPTLWLLGYLLAAYAIYRLARQRQMLDERELYGVTASLQSILEGASYSIISTDLTGIIRSFNAAAEDMLGYTAAELIGKATPAIFHDDSEVAARAAELSAEFGETVQPGFDVFVLPLRHLREGDKKFSNREWTYVRKDGIRLPVSLSVSEVRGAAGESTGYIGIAHDISERKQQEEEIRKLLTENETILSNALVGIVYLKHRRVVTCNRRLEEIFQYAPGELVGETSERFYESREAFERIGKVAYQAAGEGKSYTEELPLRHKDGSLFWGSLSGRAIDPTHPHEGSIWIYSDISERKAAEDKINELAFFDQLTGLPNRTLLLDRLKQAMTASSRSGSYGALLLVDLDNFKTVNDTHGHDMGDLLLKQVAQRLTTCLRAGDTAARLGGDEFVVMLANLSTSDRDAANQTETVGEKILATLNQPYQLGNVQWHSTPSIGVILFSGELTEIDSLLKQADLAMYKSKEAGRNALHFFDPEMEVVVMKRAHLETDLRAALAQQQFLLHYQGQVAGGQLSGAEVLVRWQHPERGMVSPLEFIPFAEETGLILPLGHWVLETACRQLSAWATQPDLAHLTVAVNVSARQFRHKDFVAQVLAVLDATRVNPQRLKLELTESLLVANVEEVIEKMHALKAKGVGFSLDDFGTGYSSLAYLKRLPLDQLKIDQSFVRDVLTDPNDAAIARTVVALAQSLGLGVIAEGVETAAQREFLASFGCHAYQGYLFSRPLPVDGFEHFARTASPSSE